jgi:hypothetical protein
MTPEEFTGIGRAVAEEITTATRQAEAALEVLRSEVTRLRALAESPIAALVLDGEGTLHLVQRSGERLNARLPNFHELVQAAMSAARDELREELRGELQAGIARTFETMGNAPAWSAAAVYTEGQIVQAHVGRTYRVRAGVRATLGQQPGDHPDQWERLGTGGFRVFKSRPEQLEAGDIFTDAESRFMHDGAATILFVPKAAKVSDIERAIKGPHNLAQAVQAQLREQSGQLEGLTQGVQRSAGAVAEVRHELEALDRRLNDLLRE